LSLEGINNDGQAVPAVSCEIARFCPFDGIRLRHWVGAPGESTKFTRLEVRIQYWVATVESETTDGV